MTTDDRIKTPCPLCKHGATFLTPTFCLTNHGRPVPCQACETEQTARATEYGRAFDANLAGIGR
jgi:hypothetical protein